MVLTSEFLVNAAFEVFIFISARNMRNTVNFMKDPERKPLNVSKRQPVSEKEQIKQLQHELTYLKQAMAFPKIFSSQKPRKVGSLLMNLPHRKPLVLMDVKKILPLMDKFNLSYPVRKANHAETHRAFRLELSIYQP